MNGREKSSSPASNAVIPEAVALRHLAEAERHIDAGARCVATQRSVVAKLDEIGRDTTRSRALLARFEDIQNEFVRHREKILRELLR